MSWTSSTEVRAQLQRRWQRGELLRAAVTPCLEWPLRLRLTGPSTRELVEHFEAVRGWIAQLAELPRVRLDWIEREHRVLGRQRLPAALWVESLDDALAILGKTREAERFQQLWEHTRAELSALLPWLERRPLQALELAERWPRLLAVVEWVQHHPRPGVYLRQVDVPGVDSKFIEAHRGVLAELLDLALPPEAIEPGASGLAQFARRYGFRDKPVRIRLRLLDDSLTLVSACRGRLDLSLDAASFARLAPPVQRVFITENEINFLAFPPLARALVIFGAGYGWEALAQAKWLHRCELHYWGDIDTHGFAILDRLRAHFPRVASLLMDRTTLLAHRVHWSEEPKPISHDLPRLSPEERALYEQLRTHALQPRLRLEQERIGYGWLENRLAGCVTALHHDPINPTNPNTTA